MPGVMFNPYVSPIELKQDWNWTGYPLAQTMAVDEAFALLDAEEGGIVLLISTTTLRPQGYGWEVDQYVYQYELIVYARKSVNEKSRRGSCTSPPAIILSGSRFLNVGATVNVGSARQSMLI